MSWQGEAFKMLDSVLATSKEIRQSTHPGWRNDMNMLWGENFVKSLGEKNKNKYLQWHFSKLAHTDDRKCRVLFSAELLSLRVQFGSADLIPSWALASAFSGLEEDAFSTVFPCLFTLLDCWLPALEIGEGRRWNGSLLEQWDREV